MLAGWEEGQKGVELVRWKVLVVKAGWKGEGEGLHFISFCYVVRFVTYRGGVSGCNQNTPNADLRPD